MSAILARGTILYLGTVNLGSASLFAYDKIQAGRGGWRISERDLCQTAIVGGWAGGLLAMHLFRHKTRKTSFQRKYVSALATNASLMLPLLGLMCANTSYRMHFGHAVKNFGKLLSGSGGKRKPPRYRR